MTLADLPRKHPKLANKPAGERRIAIIAAIGCDGDLDDLQPVAAAIEALKQEGYRTGDLPTDAEMLAARLREIPSGPRPRRPAPEKLAFSDYSMFFASLPPDAQRRVVERWGAAERDPLFRPGRLDCGAFALPGLREGNIAIVLQPPGAHRIALNGPCVDDGPAPPHSHLALCAWLTDQFRADALLATGPAKDRATA